MNTPRYLGLAIAIAVSSLLRSEARATVDAPVVLAAGDEIPGFARIDALPWEPQRRCLAADGRLAAIAQLSNAKTGIVCVDAEGPHLLVESGSAAPEGLTFTDFSHCTFTDDGGLVFAGERHVPGAYRDDIVSQLSVYKLDSSGISRLLGDHDQVSNHTTIDNSGSGVDFVANARGTVLARARSGYDTGLFLARAGQLDFLTSDIGTQWALNSNDDVVMLTRPYPWRPPDWPPDSHLTGNKLVILSNGRVRVALSSNDPALGGLYTSYFSDLKVEGDFVVFRVGSPGNEANRVFYYRISDDTLTELAGGAAVIVDIASNGNLLEWSETFSIISPSGERHVVGSSDNELVPFALNERGNVGFYAYYDSELSRSAFRMSGPPPDAMARCPRIDPDSPATPLPTPTSTPIAGIGPFRAYVIERFSDTLAVIDSATDDILANVRLSHRPNTLTVSQDGSLVFVTSQSRVDVVDTATLQVAHSIGPGETVNHLFPSMGETALGFVQFSQTGTGRVIRIDGLAGTASSSLSQRGHVVGLNDNTAIAVRHTGDPCNSQSTVFVVDLESGTTVRQVEIGKDLYGGAVVGGRAYIADNCENVLRVVDVDTLETISTIPVDQSPRSVSVAADRAYLTHGFATSGPGDAPGEYRGRLTVVDLTTGDLANVEIAGGMTDAAAVTPDGESIYVTAGGALVVLDGATLAPRARILLNGAGEVAVGPAPAAETPTPVAATPRVVVRVTGTVGLPTEEVDISVSLEADGLAVGAIEHTLNTTWNSPVFAIYEDQPECHLEPDVAASATFTFRSDCSSIACETTNVRVQADPGTSLPLDRPLYRCSVRISYSSRGPGPLIVLNPRAFDTAGQVLPAIGADGEMQVLDRDQATPRPTRTRPPTLTKTPTPTPTPTRLPVLIEIGSAAFTAGDQGSIDVVLTTNGATVAGMQNDILFSAEALIAATASGRPACTVNPEIDKPDSGFVFHPSGCDVAAGECSALRALIVSIDRVDEIPDGSVLYTCEVSAPAPGVFALPGSGLVVSALNGQRLPAEISDGLLTVAERMEPTDTPLPAPTDIPPTDTPLPAPTDIPPTDTPANTPVSSDVSQDAAGSSAGSGCNISERDPEGSLYILMGMLLLGWCARSRRAAADRR